MTLQEVSQQARELISRDGYHVPLLFVEGTKQTGVALLDLSQASDVRFLYMRTLGQQIARDKRHGDLQQLFMVSEAWMAMSADGKLPLHRPSQDPHRIEGLIISQLTVAGRKCDLAIFRMVRDSAGQLTDLKAIDLPHAGVAESPLLDAFLEGYAQATTPTH